MKEQTNNNDADGIGVSSLLGDTNRVVCQLRNARGIRPAALFLVMTICGCALFGAAIGAFGGALLAAIDALKMVGVAAFAYLLCLPSLYMFACLLGSSLSFGRIATLGLSSLAIMGCVLAAMSPVLWLFAVSTASAKIFVLLAMTLAATSLFMAMRLAKCALASGIVSSRVGIYVWFAIFTAVALQSLTLVRPILSQGDGKTPARKCIFVQHFVMTMME